MRDEDVVYKEENWRVGQREGKLIEICHVCPSMHDSAITPHYIHHDEDQCYACRKDVPDNIKALRALMDL